VGTRFTFGLDRAATAELTFVQRVPGRRVRGRCVTPSKRNRKSRRCTRNITRGKLTVDAHEGRNTVRFQGRLTARRKLGTGAYTLRIVAVGPGNLRSAPGSARFTIVR
jgi:hypothetical protein